MKKRVTAITLLLILILTCFGGCEKKTEVKPLTDVTDIGDGMYSCVYDGVERKFLLFMPSASMQGAPLMFMLHGYSGSPASFAESTGMNETAEEYGFAVVYPQGRRDPGDSTGGNGWNSGLKSTGNDDVGFLAALANYLTETYGFEKDAVFAAGFSNGAFMMYRLATKASDTFKAVASVSGAMSGGAWEERSKKASIGILQINGTDDEVIPNKDGVFGDAPSIDGVMEYWSKANGLDKSSEEKLSQKVSKCTYWSGRSDTTVCHIVIEGGKHSWPEKAFSDIDANEEILKYFSGYLE